MIPLGKRHPAWRKLYDSRDKKIVELRSCGFKVAYIAAFLRDMYANGYHRIYNVSEDAVMKILSRRQGWMSTKPRCQHCGQIIRRNRAKVI